MKSERFEFSSIPQNLEELTALREAAMQTPFQTAALSVLAFAVYPQNKEAAIEMINYLKGPRPLSEFEKQFIRDRFADGKDYLMRSYFEGALPGNDYTPSRPWALTVFDNPYSYQNEGYVKLFLQSGGADSPRAVDLRLAKDGKWYLWEQYLLPDIRKPESDNPWA